MHGDTSQQYCITHVKVFMKADCNCFHKKKFIFTLFKLEKSCFFVDMIYHIYMIIME